MAKRGKGLRLIAFMIDGQEHEDAKREAAKRGQSFSQFAREAIRTYTLTRVRYIEIPLGAKKAYRIRKAEQVG